MSSVYLTNTHHSSIGKGTEARSTGTWVRFPGPPYNSSYFFIKRSCAAFIKSPIMYPHAAARQVATKIHPMVRRWKPWCVPVNACIGNSRSQTWLRVLGPEFHKLTSPWANIPPWFAILFSFLLIPLIIIIIIINAQQINFHNKSRSQKIVNIFYYLLNSLTIIFFVNKY